MQVVGHDLRLDIKQPLEVFHACGKRTERLVVLQVPDVVAEERPFPFPQTEGVLQVAAASEDRPAERWVHQEGLRGIPSRPPEKDLASKYHPDDRIVAAGMDRAIMSEEVIGDRPKTRAGLAIFIGDGLLREIPAGHDQGALHRPQQEVVEGGVGEHDPKVAIPGGHLLGDRAVGAFPQEDDGTFRGGKEFGLDCSNFAETPHGLQVWNHDGQGLSLPVLPPSELQDRFILERVAAQVVAADPFDGDDLPLPDPGAEKAERIGHWHLVPSGVGKLQPGPARGAGSGLGMEPAIAGVLILGPTCRAHGEPGHGRPLPVVWDVQDDGEAWTAVGAVEEGITTAAILRVGQLLETVRAGGDIWRDEGGLLLLGLALLDRKGGVVADRLAFGSDALDDGEGRGLGDQRLEEGFQALGFAFHVDHDAGGVVTDRTTQAQATGQTVHEGAEADPLDDSRYRDLPPIPHHDLASTPL